jgi:ubiquinone/menaquinone biosynthesis C-methylase UbiE
MPDDQTIYNQHADLYERLISYEDYQGNIFRAIRERVELPAGHIVDLGSGTGRLTRILASHADQITALDLSAHMLAQARDILERTGGANFSAAVADHRFLPLPAACADLIVSGWSLCYLTTWGGDGWRERVTQAIGEIVRILRPGGQIIILETMGTGFETPHPPEHLLGYYKLLDELGFQSTWIRTDYRFPGLEVSRQLAAFFFGEAMGRQVIERRWQTLPECTGMWWKSRPAT